MTDWTKQEFLKELAELDTGKAQPLFHPYPVINIFQEEKELENDFLRQKKQEEELLLCGKKAMILDAAVNVTSTIEVNLKKEGAEAVWGEEGVKDAEIYFAMDKDAGFLKYAAAKGCSAIKATYGLVSRYGMETDGPSLAQPAIGAADAKMCAKALEAAAGVDKKDPMSRDAYIYDYLSALENTDLRGMKIAVPEELIGMELSGLQADCYNLMLDVFEAKGAEIETVKPEWLEYAAAVHEIIAACEKVMTADDILMSCKEEDEALSFGSWILEEEQYETYYLKALKLRSLIKDSYDLLFREYAFLAVPFTEDADVYSLAANLAGLPAMTIPFVPHGAETEDGSEILAGLHMIAGANQENHLLKAAYTYEQEVC